MDFYHSLGPLMLGSRLRRTSEYFIAEINKVYHEQGIVFDASWFPVFYILSEKQPVSIKEIAGRLQVSHSAISQLVGNLKRKQLVDTEVSGEDARRQLVRLSPKGQELLQRITPVWTAISAAFSQLAHENVQTETLFQGIAALEQAFTETALSDRITKSLHVCASHTRSL
ncbi:MarR family winged helix-turn-helix transcriptional regulator [Parapedobacter deserti]|uniref:MarR family winged helix-turn-helix transcriptional regulator n=1 Tax=Parapedobacter deserti TaxID=1912957 RepID=A0ABV7JLZ2_9SPHI